jgi:hypothetical protein
MTSVFMKASPSHRSRSQEDATIVAVDKHSGQLLHYDNSPQAHRLQVAASIFEDHPAVQLRYDLLDCRIDICSREVLVILNDDFDFQGLLVVVVFNTVSSRSALPLTSRCCLIDRFALGFHEGSSD